MKLLSKSLLLKIITLSVLLLFTFTSVGFANSSEKLDYVALGDSLAAGMTPNNTIDKGYTDIIAEKLDGEGVLGNYKNYGVPGYKTSDVMNMIDPRNLQNCDRVIAITGAEIITLDIGANDLLGLIPALTQDPTKAPTAIGGVVSNIAQIIGTVKNINPSAKIYLMGYYNAFPFLPEEQQEYLILLIDNLNSALKEAANLTGAKYVDTYAIMDKHLSKYLPEENIHPDVSGYRAIAKEFWNIIKVDFLREKK